MFGVNLAGAEFGNPENGAYGYDYIYPTASELQYYASEGMDFVRLPFLWERVQPTLDGPLNNDELGRIETFLGEAQATGTKVLLDLHDYGGYDGSKLGTAAVPVSDFEQMWAQLAVAIQPYAGAIAGYDIMNEPSNMPDSSAWPEAAQAAIDGIRSVDMTTPIYVEGDDWANTMNYGATNAALATLADPGHNIVYEAHIYFDANDSGTYAGTYDSEGAYPMIGVDRVRDFVTFLQDNHAQGFIGEYSIPDNDPRWAVVMENFLATLARDNIPSTYWAGGPWWGSYAESIEPQNGTASVQMQVLEKYITAVDNHSFTNDAVMAAVPDGVDVRATAAGLASLGVIAGDLTLHGATEATLTVQGSDGAYHSSLGSYTVAADGTIDNVNLAFADAKANIGNDAVLNFGSGTDSSMGLFLLSNGAGLNNEFAGLNLSQGGVNIYYDYGQADQRDANINDSGSHLSLVFTDANGQSTLLAGDLYFTTDRGGSTAINPDDIVHVTSGLSTPADKVDLQIGFEDLFNGGDHDYNDTVVNLTFLPSIASSADPSNPNSIVDANASGVIANTLTGGWGENTFVIAAGQAGADEILNFNAGEGDRIDIRNVLSGFDPVSSLISAFVEATQQGNNTVISVNPTGASAGTFTPVAIVDNAHLDLMAMIANHNLVVS